MRKVPCFHAQRGFLNEPGSVRGGQYPLLYEQRAARFRAQLRLDPTSDAPLQKSRGEAVLQVADLETTRQRGRERSARYQTLAVTYQCAPARPSRFGSECPARESSDLLG
jgi:hypothetical protein